MRIFKEQQRFNQLWLITLIVISFMVPIGLILGKYFKDPRSFSILELIMLIGFLLLVAAFIFSFRLNTRIDEVGIHYKFFPFHLKYRVINWNTINKAYVRQYDALSEFGGWGFKGGNLWKKSKGRAINVSGDIGIQLELNDGKKLLIGTQKKTEAEHVLETYKNKFEKNV